MRYTGKREMRKLLAQTFEFAENYYYTDSKYSKIIRKLSQSTYNHIVQNQ